MQGPFHAVSVILKEEGLRGLWSGATPTIRRSGTNQMCLFWAKNNFDRLLWGKHEGDGMQLTILQSMGSSFSAACLGPLVTGPFDVVEVNLLAFCSQFYSFRPRPAFGVHANAEFSMELTLGDGPQTRLMAQEKGEKPARDRGMLHTLATIPREEGIRALWKGLLPPLLRIPPGQAIVWAVSDQIIGHFESKQREKLEREGLA